MTLRRVLCVSCGMDLLAFKAGGSPWKPTGDPLETHWTPALCEACVPHVLAVLRGCELVDASECLLERDVVRIVAVPSLVSRQNGS